MTVKNIVYIGYPYQYPSASPHSLILCNLLLGKICKRDMYCTLYSADPSPAPPPPPEGMRKHLPFSPVERAPSMCLYLHSYGIRLQ